MTLPGCICKYYNLSLRQEKGFKECWSNEGSFFATLMEEKNGSIRYNTKEVNFCDYDYFLKSVVVGKAKSIVDCLHLTMLTCDYFSSQN